MFNSKQTLLWLLGSSASLAALNVQANNSVTFTDIAKEKSSGILYERERSPRSQVLDAIKQNGFSFPQDTVNIPLKPNGAPGVVVFDYDNDGDEDVYVTNGPGKGNSLYSSQLVESGELVFKDVAKEAGVMLPLYDNTGACYGDIDNDGDHDLMVLGLGAPNHLFENLGNGRFKDITQLNVASAHTYSTTCSMGDINNDGLLDIAISNTYDDWRDFKPINLFGFESRHQHNQMLLNKGYNHFVDVSEESGITNFAGVTWVVSLVDYDQDGDVDLITADDQGGKPKTERGGKDLGYIRIYNNDGYGQFSDVTEHAQTNFAGAWMGLSFADFNSDGHLDIFGSNIGDNLAKNLSKNIPFPVLPGDWQSTWFLGSEEGVFTKPGVGDLKATSFGWGGGAADYDNDGDTDILFYGGINMGAFVDASNPGSILNNDGNANFSRDELALKKSTNHSLRTVHGVALADLNDDGFTDVLSVSSQNWQEGSPLAPLLAPADQLGSPFDDELYIWPTFLPNNPADPTAGFTWGGIETEKGSLAIEVSNADNNNAWLKVKARGTAGVLYKSRANRDAIGAVVKFTPLNGKTVIEPILGGASFASQHSLTKNFGLGKSYSGTVDIVWPGGTRNRLYGVRAYEKLDFPEIPCSYDSQTSYRKYKRCLRSSLRELRQKGVIDRYQFFRFYISAVRAYLEEYKKTYY